MNFPYSYFSLRQQLATAVAAILDIEPNEVTIEAPDAKIDADLAVPCFRYAQKQRRSPQDIAITLAQELSVHPNLAAIDTIEAAAGYVNIKLASHALAQSLTQDILHHPTYGFSSDGHKQTVVVDLIGLNLAKPFSIGHLRPTVQGWALMNLYRALGYTVVGDNHLGDWGTPFGMWVVAFKRWGSDEALEKGGVYELGKLYVKFRQHLKDDPDLMDEAKSWLKQLEAGTAEAVAFQQRFSQISLHHMYSVLERLGVKPDENIGESFYIQKAEAFIRDLIKSGVAIEQADGSVIVDLTDYDIKTPILLRKSDGSFLYATTDILTIAYRIERWKPAKIIYSVGAEQQLHFKQVFALAHKLGYTAEFEHAWFGTIDELDETGKRQKMSSRKGISLLEELLDTAELKAAEIFPEGSPADIKCIATGAIKFSDFAQSRNLNILFDWDTIFSLNGFSGPYVQYAGIRIRSILHKARQAGIELPATPREDNGYAWGSEHQLVALALKYPSVLQNAASQNDLHPLARYAYELAKELNHYYEHAQILNEAADTRAKRLWLIGVIGGILESSLGILGIKIPGRM